MTLDAVTRLVQTLLYEGYLLYPYRRSSGKNRHHWMFGTLYPRSFAEGQGEADPWWTRTECLAHGDDATVLSLHLRFLHLAEAGAIERQVDPSPRRLGQLSRTQETVGFDVASADGARAIRGALHLSAERLHESLFKIAVRVENVTGFELGSAIIIVAIMNAVPRPGFMPDWNMWWAHTMNPRNAIPAIAYTIGR